MHEYNLLEILAVGFVLALAFGYAAHRLKLSPIVGYLLAGFLVGPHSPGFVADAGLAGQLSEAGVILLMFGVGLHFNMQDLLAVKGVSLPGAIAQSTVATALGAAVAVALGYPLSVGLFMGMGLAVASTVVLLRVLTDSNMLNTVHGHVAVGWLVVEDLFTVLILVLLPSLAMITGAGGLPPEGAGVLPLLKAFGGAALRLGALWVVVLVVGGKVVPWLITRVARTRSQELFTLTVLAAAFATAVAAAVFFQASMALGAFLGGMVIGKTKVSHKAGTDILPMRDAFAVLFFISVGMLFDPSFLLAQPLLIALCLLIVLVAKPVTAFVVVCLLGYSANTALIVAVSLAQIGEFSFILAQQAQHLGLVPDMVYNVMVVCALVSITLNPWLFGAVPAIRKFLRRKPGIWKFLNARAEKKSARGFQPSPVEQPDGEVICAIVVGYGPTGKNVVASMQEEQIRPVVIDLNMDTVNQLNADNIAAIYGDSSKRDILQAAGIGMARYLVITLPHLEQTAVTAAVAKNINPEIRILARARFLNDEEFLRKMGVADITFEENEVARALTQMVKEDIRRCNENMSLCLAENLAAGSEEF